MYEKMHSSLVTRGMQIKTSVQPHFPLTQQNGYNEKDRQYQVLVSMWRNRTHILPVGVQIGRRTLKNCLALYSTSRNGPNSSANICSPKHKHKNAPAALFTITPNWKQQHPSILASGTICRNKLWSIRTVKNYTSMRINERVLNATGFNLYIEYKTPYTKVHK